MSHRAIGVDERPDLKAWIPLSFQHVFAMFGSTVLVPLLTGLSPSTALFTSGLGTLLYIVITAGKVPAYLGSSFAFIPPIMAISAAYGFEYVMGAAFCAGIFYLCVSAVISKIGTGWIDKLLPPVVIGSVIMVIGLNLAPVAMDMAMNSPEGEYRFAYIAIAVVTLGVAIISSIVLKGFFTVIPILIAFICGYLFTLLMGLIHPSFALIDFSAVKEAAWFGINRPRLPKFSTVPIITFLLVSLATIAEHLGDTMVLSKVTGRNFLKNPGIHRTLAGDGAATALASLFGGPPNTTYGENIGVMAISRVYSVWVVSGAACIALCLSFIQKVGALISTVPRPVMGGVSMMLFGIIASAGLRTVVESGVDYSCKRNLTISSVILVVGIGGGKLMIPVGDSLSFELAGVALATLLGIILNLVLPAALNEKEEENTESDIAETA